MHLDILTRPLLLIEMTVKIMRLSYLQSKSQLMVSL